MYILFCHIRFIIHVTNCSTGNLRITHYFEIPEILFLLLHSPIALVGFIYNYFHSSSILEWWLIENTYVASLEGFKIILKRIDAFSRCIFYTYLFDVQKRDECLTTIWVRTGSDWAWVSWQDRTPKYAGQFLPDHTKSGLIFISILQYR